MSDSKAKFAEWATSFSGCDGGNPEAKTWLCGIEWGGGDDGSYYLDALPSEIDKGSYQPGSTYDWKDSLSYRYGRSFAKLYAAMQGREVSTYRNIDGYNGTEVFKLNLYPIAFRNTDTRLWHKHGLDKLTGFKDKHLYQTWCFLHRFHAFSEKLKSYSPDVIIGTGISYLSEFFLCFGKQMNERESINVEYLSSGNQVTNEYSHPIYWAKITDKTTLVVIPFFSGANGLNSDTLLQKAGETIRQIVKGEQLLNGEFS